MTETESEFDCLYYMSLDRQKSLGPLVRAGKLLCSGKDGEACGLEVCGLRVPRVPEEINGQDISCPFERPEDCKDRLPIDVSKQ